jgi:hypothetical protein
MRDDQIFLDPTAWTDYAYELNPYRFLSGSAAIFFTLMPGLIADTVQQMSTDSLTLRFTKLGSNFTPNDAVEIVGKEFGLVQFEAESEDTFRDKVENKWNYVRNYGQQPKLQEMLSEALSGSYSAGVVTELDGNDVSVPVPVSAGIPIQPYPPTSQNKTQFNVVLYLNNALGSGSYSNLVTDYQISLVREIIRTAKPIQWACREIIFIYNPSNGSTWDDGSLWDDGTTWDEGGSGYVIERHNYQTVL